MIRGAGKGIDFRLDPRVRLLFVLCISAVALITTHLAFLVPLFILVSLMALIFCYKKLLTWRKRFIQVLHVFVVIALLQSIFNPSGRALVTIFGFDLITSGGLVLGAEGICRILIIMFSAVILAAENSRRIVEGLIRWNMPYELAFMLSTALRFIPVFSEEIRNTLIAIQLRGVDMNKLSLVKRLKIYGYLLMPILSNTLVRAKDMSRVMEMRAFRAHDLRTSYIVLKMSRKDYFLLFALLFLTAAILTTYFVLF